MRTCETLAELISVIVPIYKAEPYLDQCIESITNQTYRNLEIILIDDGSPDKCPKICDRWAGKDPRILVIHQKNSGVSAARNAGIERANGAYIAFVDSDDFLEPEYIEYLYRALIETGSDLENKAAAKEKMLSFRRKIHFSIKELIRCSLKDKLIIISSGEAIVESYIRFRHFLNR